MAAVGGERARNRGPRGRVPRRPRRGRGRWLPTFAGLLAAVVVLLARGGAPRVTVKNDTARKVTVARIVHHPTWRYINPLRDARVLQPGRVDMGADYVVSGPIMALGDGTVTFASNHDTGPPSCYGRTCWPVGGIVVYRLSDGPFAGKYVYAAENITVSVDAGQILRTGQRIATAHDGFPYLETGWASGKGPETLAIADGHQCPCGDPGGWSTIEGRNFNRLLVALGAPSADVQPNPPKQDMPRRWPTWEAEDTTPSIPQSPTPLSDGSTTNSAR
jgi:hypothetical protein